jgi:hypothetical protein
MMKLISNKLSAKDFYNMSKVASQCYETSTTQGHLVPCGVAYKSTRTAKGMTLTVFKRWGRPSQASVFRVYVPWDEATLRSHSFPFEVLLQDAMRLRFGGAGACVYQEYAPGCITAMQEIKEVRLGDKPVESLQAYANRQLKRASLPVVTAVGRDYYPAIDYSNSWAV